MLRNCHLEFGATACQVPSEIGGIVLNGGVTVRCTKCGLYSRRPYNFVRVRRFFICRGCKEMIRLDDRSIVGRANTTIEARLAGGLSTGLMPKARTIVPRTRFGV
jgi:hypothetical protein